MNCNKCRIKRGYATEMKYNNNIRLWECFSCGEQKRYEK